MNIPLLLYCTLCSGCGIAEILQCCIKMRVCLKHSLILTLLSWSIHATGLIYHINCINCIYSGPLPSSLWPLLAIVVDSYLTITTFYLCIFTKPPDKMKAFAILSVVVFAAFAVAGPSQTYKRQVHAWSSPTLKITWEYIGWQRWVHLNRMYVLRPFLSERLLETICWLRWVYLDSLYVLGPFLSERLFEIWEHRLTKMGPSK